MLFTFNHLVDRDYRALLYNLFKYLKLYWYAYIIAVLQTALSTVCFG